MSTYALKIMSGPTKSLLENIDIPFEVDEQPVEQPKARMRELSTAEREGNFNEVELGFVALTAGGMNRYKDRSKGGQP